MIEKKGLGNDLILLSYPGIIDYLIDFCRKVDENQYVTDLIDGDTLLAYRDLAYTYSKKEFRIEEGKNEDIPWVQYAIIKLDKYVEAAKACDIGWDLVTHDVSPITIESDEFFVITREFIDSRKQKFRDELNEFNESKLFNEQPFQLEDGVEFLTIGECLDYYKQLRNQGKKRNL